MKQEKDSGFLWRVAGSPGGPGLRTTRNGSKLRIGLSIQKINKKSTAGINRECFLIII